MSEPTAWSKKEKIIRYAVLFCLAQYVGFWILLVMQFVLLGENKAFNANHNAVIFYTHILSAVVMSVVAKRIAKSKFKFDLYNYVDSWAYILGVGFFIGILIFASMMGVVNASDAMGNDQRTDDQIVLYGMFQLPLYASIGFILLSLLAAKSSTAKPEIQIQQSKDAEKPALDRYVIPNGDTGYLPSTSHGTSRWLSDHEKNKLSAFTKLPEFTEAQFKGLWIGGGFFNHIEGNLITLAPPGQGKGAALIIPNLLWKRDYPHSFIVFDPKGINACVTARFQKEECGKEVFIIDPMNLQQENRAIHGIKAACFNPLDFIKNDLFNGTKRLVHILLPDDPKADAYWITDARNLMQLILHYIMLNPGFQPEQRNLITLYQLMLSADYPKLLADIAQCPTIDENNTHKAIGFLNSINGNPKMISAVRIIANSALDWIGNPALSESLKRSDFDPADLDKGNMAIYLCQPLGDQEAFAAYSKLIVGSFLRENIKPRSYNKAWVYYLLDEFPTMGKFTDIVKNLSVAREYKMRIWLFAQSISQIDRIYDEETRNDICGSAVVFQGFGLTDSVSQEYLSKRIGDTTVSFHTTGTQEGSSDAFADAYTQTVGSNSGQNGGGSSSSTTTGTTSTKTYNKNYNENQNYVTRPLIAPSETGSDPHIITITKDGYMRLVKWQYFEKPSALFTDFFHYVFSDGRADHNPNFSYPAQAHPQGSYIYTLGK